MRFLAERTQFRRDRVVVPIARKHLLPDPLFFRCIFSGRSRRRRRQLGGGINEPRHDHGDAQCHLAARLPAALRQDASWGYRSVGLAGSSLDGTTPDQAYFTPLPLRLAA
jgi:hypothetical protein